MDAIPYVLFFFVMVGFIIYGCVKLYQSGEGARRKSMDEATQERELFERIMQTGTDEQKLIALQYKELKKLNALRGLVMFDIFFR
jgi:hypothetical protein